MKQTKNLEDELMSDISDISEEEEEEEESNYKRFDYIKERLRLENDCITLEKDITDIKKRLKTQKQKLMTKLKKRKDYNKNLKKLNDQRQQQKQQGFSFDENFIGDSFDLISPPELTKPKLKLKVPKPQEYPQESK